MEDRPLARIIVEGCRPQDDMRIGRTIGHEMRTADRAEAPQLAGRGFVGTELVLAREPAEMLAHDAGGRGEGGGMRLAAGSAVAMADRRAQPVDFIAEPQRQLPL